MHQDSPHWDLINGVCRKHMLPSVPCPACVAGNDPDMEYVPDAWDYDMLIDDPDEEDSGSN